ncbi:MAG: tyrosine-type recombinase/integrase [Dehalococcoidia bacterium]
MMWILSFDLDRTLTLRHSRGFYLANQGYDLRLIQNYLGHRDPKHAVHYTRVAGVRFEGLWKS